MSFIEEHAVGLVFALATAATLIAAALVVCLLFIRRHGQELLDATREAELARDEAEAMNTRLCRQIELTHEWQHASETDALTGLLNRGGGERRIRNLLRCGKTGLFCLMDVDAFKQINDQYGHEAGDAALRGLGDCMRCAFRENDVLIRFGGDEFAVFATDVTGEEQARRCMDRFLSMLETLEVKALPGMRISVSVGAILCPGDGEEDFDVIYRRADDAMYDSKDHREGSCYHLR